jgi:hypothetical protein
MSISGYVVVPPAAASALTGFQGGSLVAAWLPFAGHSLDE